MTGHVSAIDCPNCGAGISVLGGGRITTQVCSYCGASLDASDAFQVLRINAERPRPASPFRLGMTGLIDGVEHTIIGTIGMVERYRGQTWHWVDHMLYSPTHGYSWLTVEDGHTLLSRKVRDWPTGAFVTASGVELAETRPERGWRGRDYRYYSTSDWEIDFVEGGFTWRPEVGQRGSTVSFMSKKAPNLMLGYADGAEREIEVTRYFPEAAEAFGAEPTVPEGVHALQPYVPAPGKRFYTSWFMAMTAAALLVALVVMLGSGPRVTLFEGRPLDLPMNESFDVATASRPVRVHLFQELSQTWSEYEVSLFGPSGEPIAETSRGISYYFGGSGEDSWSEGSRHASLTFQPPEAGRYKIRIDLAEAEGAGRSIPVRVQVQEGFGRSLWSWIAAGLFLLALLWTASSGLRHKGRRWAGSDWTEEDDD